MNATLYNAFAYENVPLEDISGSGELEIEFTASWPRYVRYYAAFALAEEDTVNAPAGCSCVQPRGDENSGSGEISSSGTGDSVRDPAGAKSARGGNSSGFLRDPVKVCEPGGIPWQITAPSTSTPRWEW